MTHYNSASFEFIAPYTFGVIADMGMALIGRVYEDVFVERWRQEKP